MLESAWNSSVLVQPLVMRVLLVVLVSMRLYRCWLMVDDRQ
jgi:hypothetical protein